MTEKDLLDSLRFVDDDLIEEAGLEQLKEEKQKKTNGKVIFFRTALTAAAGICIFAAGTVMGRKITAKKDQTDGVLMMAAYPESEYEKEILALEGSETLAEAEAYAEPEDKNTLSVSTITLGEETKSQISEDETSNTALPATNIGGIDVKKKVRITFSLHLNKIMFPILCRLIRCAKSCRQQQIRSAAWA